VKAKKSVIISSPIFSVKYSSHNPTLLASCDESGCISIIDTSFEPEKKNIHSSNRNINSSSSNFNNNLSASTINPIFKYNAHDNAIYDLEWCFSDKKLVTASGDMNCKIYNFDKGNFLNEYTFIGHYKSVKSIKQAFFNDNIFISCGRDGIIYLWDIRNKKLPNIAKNFIKGIFDNIFRVFFYKM